MSKKKIRFAEENGLGTIFFTFTIILPHYQQEKVFLILHFISKGALVASG
jgi:hypothetical protein